MTFGYNPSLRWRPLTVFNSLQNSGKRMCERISWGNTCISWTYFRGKRVNILDSLYQNSDLLLHGDKVHTFRAIFFWLALKLKPRVGTLYCFMSGIFKQNRIYSTVLYIIASVAWHWCTCIQFGNSLLICHEVIKGCFFPSWQFYWQLYFKCSWKPLICCQFSCYFLFSLNCANWLSVLGQSIYFLSLAPGPHISFLQFLLLSFE